MKPRISVWRRHRSATWGDVCDEHAMFAEIAPTWRQAMDAANAHARTHRRTDIASFLALRDDHPASDRRWETPLPHDLEPPC